MEYDRKLYPSASGIVGHIPVRSIVLEESGFMGLGSKFIMLILFRPRDVSGRGKAVLKMERVDYK